MGTLEAAVMEKLWDDGVATVNEVRGAVSGGRLTFNTVMTVMNRLVAKGWLARNGSRRPATYRPTTTRGDFLEAMARDLSGGFVREFGTVAVVQFVAALESEDPARLAELEALLEERRRRSAEPRRAARSPSSRSRCSSPADRSSPSARSRRRSVSRPPPRDSCTRAWCVCSRGFQRRRSSS